MNRLSKKIISIILAFSLIIGCSASAYAADTTKSDNSKIIAATNAINGILDGAFAVFGAMFPKGDMPTVDEYYEAESKNFYEGTENLLDSPADGAKWSLGFAKESIVPENLADGSKEYYTGGYFTQKVSSVYDDQTVHAIALADGSERGTAIFASIDGIGVGNADIREIRALAERKLKESGIESDIIAININSTHCHTVIDTQGFSLALIPKALNNLFSWLPFIDPVRSIDEEFLDIMIDGASDAIVNAYKNMESGSLYYFETAGIGKNEETGVYAEDKYGYLTNKRYDTEGFQHKFACFKFVPDNESSTETVFSNLGAHPTTIDRATDKLSSDFPCYIEKKINESGMNFMFIQGAQSPISVRKSGVETESVIKEVEAEIAADSTVSDYRAAKSLGYEFARLIIEAQDSAKPVAPLLNVKMAECTVPLDRGLLQLGASSQLLGFTTVKDKESPSNFSIITEVGYIEIGTDIVMLTVPGELIPQLVYGNVVTAEDAYLGTDWNIQCTEALIDADKTVLVMGLCNDAIGYIIPDNDYAPFIADSLWALEIGDRKIGEEIFGEYHRHYEETLSTGSKAASSVMTALNELVKSAA